MGSLFDSNLNISNYNYNDYRKFLCKFKNVDTGAYIGEREYPVYHYSGIDKFQVSEELVCFNIQLESIPRIINDLSYTSSYGLDTPKCIVVPFNSEVLTPKGNTVMGGAIIKFYLPKGVSEFRIQDKFSRDVVNVSEIQSEPVNHWNEYYADRYNEDYGLSIQGYKFVRTHSIVITSSIDPDLPKYSELAVHMSIPYNEHLGQSALTWYDLRPNIFISTIFSNILFCNKKNTLVNGTLICDDFSKFYIGSPSTEE